MHTLIRAKLLISVAIHLYTFTQQWNLWAVPTCQTYLEVVTIVTRQFHELFVLLLPCYASIFAGNPSRSAPEARSTRLSCYPARPCELYGKGDHLVQKSFRVGRRGAMGRWQGGKELRTLSRGICAALPMATHSLMGQTMR